MVRLSFYTEMIDSVLTLYCKFINIYGHLVEYNRAADSSGESTGTSPMNSPESDTFRRSKKIGSKSSTHIRIPRWALLQLAIF
jgi:hypothetical protein